MGDVSRRRFLGVAAGAAAGWMVRAPGAWAQAAPPGVTRPSAEAIAQAIRLGHASHAFDHLGAFGMQAEACAASGATVIYATGIGGDGYEGLPEAAAWQQRLEAARAYTEKAKSLGIPVVLGYLCATSIVGLKDFDAHWPADFRERFKSTPADWLQRDLDGKPLPSWYGGEYEPACMNHPDWRAYQREMVRFQIETGHGGIFFDNPTVHPNGCYCDHCMGHFRAFLEREASEVRRPAEGTPKPDAPDTPGTPEISAEAKAEAPAAPVTPAIPNNVAELRALAQSRRDDFRRFRTTIARDFLAEMRAHARTLDPNALITANNSTNSPGVIYSQCSNYGYSPFEMSRAQDLVVIEDMATQPRTLDDGTVLEYGPTYRQLQALCHGKPLVVCTIADADYHTPPNLMRLAMAEAAANQATYMVWATWPEEQRPRMIEAARRQVNFLRQHAHTYTKATPRSECALFLPMRRWLQSDTCAASDLAAKLSRDNMQYTVFTEEELMLHARDRNILIEDDNVLDGEEARALSLHGASVWKASREANWLESLRRRVIPRAVTVEGAPSVRAYVFDTDEDTYVHLLNLDVRKKSSFEDEVRPAKDVVVRVRIDLRERAALRPVIRGRTITAELFTADDNTTRGAVRCVASKDNEVVTVTVGVLEVHAILTIHLA